MAAFFVENETVVVVGFGEDDVETSSEIVVVETFVEAGKDIVGNFAEAEIE